MCNRAITSICALPSCTGDSAYLEGLGCSLLETSQLFQAAREYLLKRPWWFEKVNVLPLEKAAN